MTTLVVYAVLIYSCNAIPLWECTKNLGIRNNWLHNKDNMHKRIVKNAVYLNLFELAGQIFMSYSGKS